MNGVQLATTIVATLGAVLGAGGLIKILTIGAENRKLMAEARKTGADAATVLSETALTLVAPLRHEIDRLKKQVEILEEQVELCSRKIERANQLLADHPEWTPPRGLPNVPRWR